MPIYANTAKTRYLEERLTDTPQEIRDRLTIVQLDVQYKSPEGQLRLAVEALSKGQTVVLLSIIPITDYRDVPGYAELPRTDPNLYILDSTSQYIDLDRILKELSG